MYHNNVDSVFVVNKSLLVAPTKGALSLWNPLIDSKRFFRKSSNQVDLPNWTVYKDRRIQDFSLDCSEVVLEILLTIKEINFKLLVFGPLEKRIRKRRKKREKRFKSSCNLICKCRTSEFEKPLDFRGLLCQN